MLTLSFQENKTHRTIRIEEFHVRDIAVTDDLKWLLCVGKSRTGAKDNRKQKYEIVRMYTAPLPIYDISDLS